MCCWTQHCRKAPTSHTISRNLGSLENPMGTLQSETLSCLQNCPQSMLSTPCQCHQAQGTQHKQLTPSWRANLKSQPGESNMPSAPCCCHTTTFPCFICAWRYPTGFGLCAESPVCAEGFQAAFCALQWVTAPRVSISAELCRD